MLDRETSATTLLIRYRRELSELGYESDPAQLEVVEKLQQISDALVQDQNNGQGLLDRIKRYLGNQRTAPCQGLYLWGGVGRGKTFLVDLMYQNLAITAKRRVHFHRFMLSIHRRLNELKSVANPLEQVADDLARETRLLCLDELFVDDIADAMVLAGLFRGLLERGMVLVFTSNTELGNLYRNGLQRERFLPAIELLRSHCMVHEMGGVTDYRLRTLEQAETYICPHRETSDRQLEDLFRTLAGDEPVDRAPLNILGRNIAVRMASEGIAWFSFDDLCDGPRSKADYTELSRFHHTLIVSGIPHLDRDREDPARRFVELVDELYDRQVNVILSAHDMPEYLYSGQRLRAAFERTVSRIREFSSPAYMALPHRP